MVINKSKCEQQKTAKKVRSISKDHGFGITTEKNIFQTDFLDITLNLRNNLNEPYKNKNSDI